MSRLSLQIAQTASAQQYRPYRVLMKACACQPGFKPKFCGDGAFQDSRTTRRLLVAGRGVSQWCHDGAMTGVHESLLLNC